ncbi:MAG: GntR family transcriptional regulator [Chloroflexia bacterium]|nr:GntR family transcriptional regulator [Chloroflexia bacterium]
MWPPKGTRALPCMPEMPSYPRQKARRHWLFGVGKTLPKPSPVTKSSPLAKSSPSRYHVFRFLYSIEKVATSMGVTRLQSPATLREATVEHLRNEIITGGLKPGELVRDAELAAQLGLSPTPVREAFVQLASEGLIEIEPNKLKRVAPINLVTIRELAAVQRVLWQTGYAWGVPKVGSAALDALGGALTDLHEARDKGNLRAMMLAHTDFHSIVVAAAGNRELGRIIADRYPLLERFILLRMPTYLSSEIIELDQAIYVALQQGDQAHALAIGEVIRERFAAALEAQSEH